MPKILGTPQVRFNISGKPGTSNQAYISLVYRYKYKGVGQRLKYNVGAVVDRKQWDNKAQRAKPNRKYPEYFDLNKRLNNLENIVIEIYKENDGNIQVEDFKNEIAYRIGDKARPEDDKSQIPTFCIFLDQFITDQRKSAKPNTFKKYQTAANHLKDFSQESGIELGYDSINWQFRQKFIDWLFSAPRKHSTNSVAKTIAMVRSFLKESYRAGYHTNEIFKDSGFAVREVKTKNKVRLSLEELDALLDLDLSGNERLERVRDLFIVGAFSGLRFSDWHKITKDQVITTPEGLEMIQVMAEKTRKYTPIPLLPELKNVLEKYDYKLPKISSQRFNDYIKEVAKLALGNASFMRIYSEGGQLKDETVEKWQAISSHAARRSFVSNFLQLEISPTLIRAITGHSSEKQLLAYADIEADELAVTFAKKAASALQEHRKKVKRIG